ncbi:hydantoinase/oxoprolinase family protein [Brucella cytisi]|uniref:Hydantoin utilization protein A n=1 Tax=Brucella cytisi TaxID=407152 RepID=A0A1J6IF60_9HYPH|nr:hydantoinase/oxoprolinase family protein [Brucella cytisi]OIS93728.1 hypothetical protein BLA27_10100 [Brucella cytisi]
MNVRIGIDIGGTFTDVSLLREDGSALVFKTPSTPAAPEKGVIRGIEIALERAEVTGADCVELIIGATVGLNAIIERKGAPVGFLVTAGFEDMLELGRVKMNNVFSLKEVRRPPLIRKNWVRGIEERLSAQGEIIKPLDPRQLIEATRELVEMGAQTIALLFLHSYRNPLHERIAKESLQNMFPGLDVAISSELWPQLREYERATVLAMNSYISPKTRSYITAIETEKRRLGIECPVYVSASNGGLVPASQALERPIATLLSGPSAGVVAAVELMRRSSVTSAITFDMGGTSADICVLEQDDIPYAWGQEIQGLPVIMPYVDVSAIGSGGGSIAFLDNAGLLRVGPQSAGSNPGPAAYGRGGSSPTVTDAYLVSGFIDAENFIGGEIDLSLDRAVTAIETVAGALGMTVAETAMGIIKITTSVQVAELTRLAAKRGIDLRDFTLVPFGGAGPTQACLLADELQIRKIVIPAAPGVFCAFGAAQADFRLDYVRTVYGLLSTLPEADVEAWYASQEEQARLALSDVADRIRTFEVIRTADVRYAGQGFEISIPFATMDDIDQNFRVEYAKRYGPQHGRAPVEVIAFRATVVGCRMRPPQAPRKSCVAAAAVARREILLGGRALDVPVYQRSTLNPGWRSTGPFLIDQSDTTCLVTSGWQAWTDEYGALHLTKETANA